MKASKFAQHFGISIIREDHLDSEGYPKRFYIKDKRGILKNKESFSIDGISYCVGALIKDYVDKPLEESGFVFDSKRKSNRYKQALAFLKGKKEQKELYDVINCIYYPVKIKDDISPKGIDFMDAKIFLKGYFMRNIPDNVIMAVETNEGMSLDEIITVISSLPRLQIKEFNDYFALDCSLNNSTEYLEETVETIHSLIAEATNMAA